MSTENRDMMAATQQAVAEDNAYQAGIDARNAGMGEESCPFIGGDCSALGRLWFAGFDDAAKG